MPFKFVNRISCIVNRKKKNMPDEPLTINNKPAFTLLELIIVIALIGIISSIGFYSYQGSQKKARDAQRKSDLQQVKKALEANKNDCLAGSYYIYYGGVLEQTRFNVSLKNYFAGFNEKYLQTMVIDPKNAYPYSYGFSVSSTYTNNACPNPSTLLLTFRGTKYYVLRALLEITTDPDTDKSYTACSTAINTDVGVAQFDSFQPPAPGDGYYYVCPD